MSFDTDWLLLSLRLIFIVILYFFLYQIVRLTTRELSLLAKTSESASPTSRRNTARLVLLDPAETLLISGTGFTLEPTTLVGRRPGCTIVLDDSFVSAEHAELERTRDGWLLHDLGSTNGTFVNEQEVAGTHGIDDGDIVQFGRVTMRLVC